MSRLLTMAFIVIFVLCVSVAADKTCGPKTNLDTALVDGISMAQLSVDLAKLKSMQQRAQSNRTVLSTSLDHAVKRKGNAVIIEKVPFDKSQHDYPSNSTNATIEVYHDGNQRGIELKAPEGVQHWSSFNCGPMDENLEKSCDAQPCHPSKDATTLIPQGNYRSVVSVGPYVLGSVKRVAIIGIAGGSMVHFLHRLDPLGLKIDAVEYSPTVANLTKRCFAFPESTQVQLHTNDGLAFLKQQGDQTYDWIIIDASGSVADRFAIAEAYAEYKRVLKPWGFVTYNSVGFGKYPELFAAGIDQAKTWFAHGYNMGESMTISDHDLNGKGYAFKRSANPPPNASAEWQAVHGWFTGLHPMDWQPMASNGTLDASIAEAQAMIESPISALK